MTPEHGDAPALEGAGAVAGNQRASQTQRHLTEPTIVGAFVPSAVMSWIIAENIATGTIEFPEDDR